MGLDMYLNRSTYVQNWKHMKPEERHSVIVKFNGKDHPYIDLDKITYIEEEVVYWRKANAIHKWFVDNVQDGTDDCRRAYVDIDDLKKLYYLCIQMQEYYAEHGDEGLAEYASECLPTEEGFFFGNTDYEDAEEGVNYYMDTINYTVKKLKPLLDLHDKIIKARDKGERIPFPDYEYRSSW